MNRNEEEFLSQLNEEKNLQTIFDEKTLPTTIQDTIHTQK